jgi:hypothetical protein
MTMELRWAEEAATDLEHITDYLFQNAPERAAELASKQECLRMRSLTAEARRRRDLKTKWLFSASQRLGYENGCAEGILDCGSSSYRFCLARLGGMSAWKRTKSGSFAAAVQSASRIFIHGGEPQAHGNLR